MPGARGHRVWAAALEPAGIDRLGIGRPAGDAALVGSVKRRKGEPRGCGACAHHSGRSVTDFATPPSSSPVWRASRVLLPVRLRSGPCVVADAGCGALVVRDAASGVGRALGSVAGPSACSLAGSASRPFSWHEGPTTAVAGVGTRGRSIAYCTAISPHGGRRSCRTGTRSVRRLAPQGPRGSPRNQGGIK